MKFIFVLVFSFFSFSAVFAQDLLPIAQSKRVGYINTKGDIVISPTLDTKVEWSKEIFRGKIYRFPKFPQNAYFSDSMAIALLKERFWGYPYKSHYVLINANAQIIRDEVDLHTGRYSDGIAITESKPAKGIKDNDNIKYSYVDIQGEYLTKWELFFAGEFYNGIALILKDSLFGYINKKMDWVIEPQFEMASHFSEGLAPVSTKKLWGFIDQKGGFVIPEIYQMADQFYSGLALVMSDGAFNYINKKGETINRFPLQDAYRFYGKRALVVYQNAYGYMGTDGEFAIKPQYEAADNFSEGLAAVCVDGKWGFIDENNNFTIKPTYDYVKSFQNGAALVFENSKLHYINISGKIIYTF